jgi:hypothetical protein
MARSFSDRPVGVHRNAWFRSLWGLWVNTKVLGNGAVDRSPVIGLADTQCRQLSVIFFHCAALRPSCGWSDVARSDGGDIIAVDI